MRIAKPLRSIQRRQARIHSPARMRDRWGSLNRLSGAYALGGGGSGANANEIGASSEKVAAAPFIVGGAAASDDEPRPRLTVQDAMAWQQSARAGTWHASLSPSVTM